MRRPAPTIKRGPLKWLVDKVVKRYARDTIKADKLRYQRYAGNHSDGTKCRLLDVHLLPLISEKLVIVRNVFSAET